MQPSGAHAALAGAIGSTIGSRLEFEAWLDQRERLLQLEGPLPALALVPERARVRDSIGEPFEAVIDCVSTSTRLELKALIGEELTLRMRQSDGRYKPLHGHVVEAAQLGSDGGLARYRLVMKPWLALLALRRDSFVWQDCTALAIVEDLFRDYPQANHRVEIVEPLQPRSVCTQYRETDLDFVARLLAEEGLTFRFEHLEGEAAEDAGRRSTARHRLVIVDRAASWPDLGPMRFTGPRPSFDRRTAEDVITRFASARQLVPNAVAIGSWNDRLLVGISAEDRSTLALGDLPLLPVYDGSGASRHGSTAEAERAARLALQAFESEVKRFEGRGGVRSFEAGRRFALIDHPLYGADVALLGDSGGSTAVHRRDDHGFVLLDVEHRITNNLGIAAAERLGSSELEQGAYRNEFRCAPAAAPIVPTFLRKPTAPGVQTALVVGLADEALTTDRDHRVKLQFPWQRGERPVAGGLPHESLADPAGNAPGSDASGGWVRVALPSAGANWGTVLVPRIGTEVLVGFIEGDIDRPIVIGQLWNGQDRPPFAAGLDAGADHAGVLSGLQTSTLDGSGFNQWVLDDATGQLRMRMMTSHADTELGLGHLIRQHEHSARRGSWRGSGFEATTRGWTTVRAARGLFLSTHARSGRYGSADGTQMDASEAVSQLRAARELGARLGGLGAAQDADPLAGFAAGGPVEALVDRIDPGKLGRHEATVGGQQATKPCPDKRTPGSTPVEALADPLVLLATPSTAVFASEASVQAYAGLDANLVAGGELQQTAGATYSSISGKTTSVHAASGGVTAIAGKGPASLQAHADRLEIVADRDVTIVSVNDSITIGARTRIELIVGASSVVLDGSDITFSTPGRFEARFSAHAFTGAGSVPAALPQLPGSLTGVDAETLHLEHRYHDDEALAGASYELRLPDGSVRTGKLDDQGKAVVDGIQAATATVVYGPAPGVFERKDRTPTPGHDPQPDEAALRNLVAKYLDPARADPSPHPVAHD